MGAHCARSCFIDEPQHVATTESRTTAAEATPSASSQHSTTTAASQRSGEARSAILNDNKRCLGRHVQHHHHRHLGPPAPPSCPPKEAPPDSSTSVSFEDAVVAACSGARSYHQHPQPQEPTSHVLNPLTVRFCTDDIGDRTAAEGVGDGATQVASPEERQRLEDADLQLWTCGRGAGAGTLRKAATALMPIITGACASTNMTCSTTACGDQRLVLSSSQCSAPTMCRTSCSSTESQHHDHHAMGGPISLPRNGGEALTQPTSAAASGMDAVVSNAAADDRLQLACDEHCPVSREEERPQQQHRNRYGSAVHSGDQRRSVASTVTTTGARDPELEVSIAVTSWGSSRDDGVVGLHRQPPRCHDDKHRDAPEEGVEFDIDAMPVNFQLGAA